MGYFDSERPLDLGFIQHRIVRTGCLGGIFVGMQRAYLAGIDAGKTMNGYSEDIP